MASIAGLAFGALFASLISGAFSKQEQRFTQETNSISEALGAVIQRAAATTGQTVTVNQNIDLEGATLNCPAGATIRNDSKIGATAIGKFDVQSAAEIQNAIINQLNSDIVQDTNVRTSFGSALPSGTTSAQIMENIHNIVRQVYSSENLNSMLQTIQVNQGMNLRGVTIEARWCDIRNVSSANLLADNSLRVLSQALLTNKITNEFITSVNQRYQGTAQGIFGPISDFIDMIRWVAIAIVIIIGIVLIVGAILKFLAVRGGTPAAGPSSLQQLLLLDALTTPSTPTAAITSSTSAVTTTS